MFKYYWFICYCSTGLSGRILLPTKTIDYYNYSRLSSTTKIIVHYLLPTEIIPAKTLQTLPTNSLRAWSFHPLKSILCLSATLWNPDATHSFVACQGPKHASTSITVFLCFLLFVFIFIIVAFSLSLAFKCIFTASPLSVLWKTGSRHRFVARWGPKHATTSIAVRPVANLSWGSDEGGYS